MEEGEKVKETKGKEDDDRYILEDDNDDDDFFNTCMIRVLARILLVAIQ